MATTERIGFGLEFGYPALLMLIIGAAPTAIGLALGQISSEAQQFSSVHPATSSVLQFLVHTWGIFFVIVAGVIISIGTMQLLLGVRMKRAHAGTGTH